MNPDLFLPLSGEPDSSEAAARAQANIDAIANMLPDVDEVFGQAMAEGKSKPR